MTRTLPFALAAALLLTCGCASVDYVGERRAPVADARVVLSKDALVGHYEPMGRAIASMPAGFSGDQLREALEEKAEEVGAHAVVLGEYRKVVASTHVRWDYTPYSGPYPGWSVGGGYAWTGYPFSYGWREPTRVYSYDLELKALFMRRVEPETATK